MSGQSLPVDKKRARLIKDIPAMSVLPSLGETSKADRCRRLFPSYISRAKDILESYMRDAHGGRESFADLSPCQVEIG